MKKYKVVNELNGEIVGKNLDVKKAMKLMDEKNIETGTFSYRMTEQKQ